MVSLACSSFNSTNYYMKVSTKKAIAREVLILVILACTGLLIYSFLFSKNYVIESLKSNLWNENHEYRNEINSASVVLPIERFFTNEVKELMSEAYRIDGDTVYVYHKSVPFVEHNYKKAERLSSPSVPYLNKEFRAMTVKPKDYAIKTIDYTCDKELAIKVKFTYSFLRDIKQSDKELTELLHSKFPSESTLKTMLYVLEVDEFFNHLESKDYQDAFYAFINESIRPMDKAEFEELIAQVSQRKHNRERVKELEAKYSHNVATINGREKYFLEKDRMWPVTLNILVVLGIAVYPLRFIVRAVKWSICTLRTSER